MAIVKEQILSNYIYECNHIDIIKHDMGFVCQNCGLVIPRISYNNFMISLTEKRKHTNLEIKDGIVLKPYAKRLLELDKKFNSEDEKEQNRIAIEIGRIISYFDLVYDNEEINVMSKIIFRYRSWHRKEYPLIKLTNLIKYIIPACLLVLIRQKGVMMARKDIMEFCGVESRIFNKTFTLACKFLGFRNSYETNFKNNLLKIIYSLNLPFSVFNDSLFIFKKYSHLFTSGPKNCAVLCSILSYYSLAKITDFHDNVRLTPFIERFKYQNLLPLRGEALRVLLYFRIPIKNTKDVYQLYKYRKKIFC